MSTRITERDLQAVVARINRETNAPAEPYVMVNGRMVAQIGNYHLDFAYSGVQLVRMVSGSGGIADVLGIGHATKRDCYHAMHAFLRGIETGRAK